MAKESKLSLSDTLASHAVALALAERGEFSHLKIRAKLLNGVDGTIEPSEIWRALANCPFLVYDVQTRLFRSSDVNFTKT